MEPKSQGFQSYRRQFIERLVSLYNFINKNFFGWCIAVISTALAIITIYTDEKTSDTVRHYSSLTLSVFVIIALIILTINIFSLFYSRYSRSKILKVTMRFLECDKTSYPPIKCEVDVLTRLVALEEKCLTLLFRDQLPETGGWAKSYIWRDVFSGQSFSAAGTFTGTYIVIEALRARGFEINQIPLIDNLKESIKTLSTNKGRYYRNKKITSQNLERWEYQNLRHTAAVFLIENTLNKINSESSKNIDDAINHNTINYIESILKFTIEDQNPLDLAIITRSLLIYLKETGDIEIMGAVQSLWEYLYSLSQDSETIRYPRLLWQDIHSTSAVNRAIEQWSTVWAVLPLLELYSNLEKDKTEKLINSVVNFVIDTFKHKKNELLPLGFWIHNSNDTHRCAKNSPPQPIGQSVFATAMAIHICHSIQLLTPHYRCELNNIKHKLLYELSKTNIEDMSLNFNSNDPKDLQGYLDFAAVILCYATVGQKPSNVPITDLLSTDTGFVINNNFSNLNIEFSKEDLYHYKRQLKKS